MPIAFAETKEQFEALLEYRKESCSKLEIIPVTPFVDYFTEKTGEKYRTLESFCPMLDLINQGDENIKIAERFSEEYDRLLQRVCGNLPEIQWVSMKAFFHTLKGFLDSLAMRSLPVLRAFESLQADEVICFHLSKYSIQGPYLADKPSLSLTSRIAALVGSARGCKIKWLSLNPAASNGEINACDSDNVISRSRLAKTTSFSLRSEALRHISYLKTALKGISPRRRKQALLIQAIFGDLGSYVLKAWKDQGMGEVRSFSQVFPEEDIHKRMDLSLRMGQEVWRIVWADPGIRRYFLLHGADLFSLAESLLDRISRLDIPDLIAFAPVAVSELANKKDAVILTGGMNGRNSVLGKVANSLGIPFVSMHYGGFLGYSLLPMHERYDMADADYFICNGEGAAKTFERPSPFTFWNPAVRRAKPVPIGSPWLESVVKTQRQGHFGGLSSNDGVPYRGNGNTPAKRTVMYIMSAMVGDNRYLGYVYHPEIWYWRFQRKLVRLFLKFPETKILLKPPLHERYPQIENPLFQWLETVNCSNVEVMGNVQLEKVLDRADAFILDSPSTPLLYVVATEKPIIAYIDRLLFKLVPEAGTLLKKRAFLAETADAFFEEVVRFLEKPEWRMPKPVNDEFLNTYCTYASDGRSAERCAKFLHDLALKKANLEIAKGGVHERCI